MRKFSNPAMQLNLRIDSRKFGVILLYTFGIYGWGTIKSQGENFALYSFISYSALLLVLLTFYRLEKIKEWSWNLKIRLSVVDLCVFIGFFVFTLSIHRNSILDPLTVDELAYAKMANIHGYSITIKYIAVLKDLSGNLPLSIAIQLVSIFLFIVAAMCIHFLLEIRSAKNYYLFVGTLIIVLRIIVNSAGGNSSPHPPLAFFPYSIFSSIFGVNSFSYRLCSLVMTSIFLTVLLRCLLRATKNISFALLFIASIVFTPLIRDSMITLEPSIWTFWVYSIAILKMVELVNKTSQSILIALSILSYLRVTVLLLFLVLIVVCWRSILKDLKERNTIVLSMVTFIVPNTIVTSFTRFRQNEMISESGNDLSPISRFTAVFEVARSALTFPILALVILSFSFVFFLKFHQRGFVILVSTLVYFFVFLIPRDLIENAKYLLEYLLPFVALSALAFKSQAEFRWMKLIALCSTCVVFIFGVTNYAEVQRNVSNVQTSNPNKFDSTYRFLIRIPLPYDVAFSYMQGRRMNCLNAGVVYGQFPEVLAQLVPAQVEAAQNYSSKFLSWQSRFGESWRTISKGSLEASGANCALLGSVDDRNSFMASLRDTKWSRTRTFKHSRYGTSLILIEKAIDNN
jgi:hypothetical protein